MIISLVSVYNPDADVREHIQAISDQVDKVYICDNSKESHRQDFAGDNIIYIFNNGNLGLSLAFNKVLKNEENFSDNDYIIFFDQDSSIEEGHIQKLIEEYEMVEASGYKLGCLGPAYFDINTNQLEEPTLKTDINKYSYQVKSIITSSMLCKYKTLKAVGFWNEEAFLDLADWDICWRMGALGYVCCMTRKVILRHALGNGEKNLGPIKAKEGAPIREYYQTRDSLYLYKKPYVPFKYKVRLWMNVYIRPMLHLAVLSDKDARKDYIKRGKEDYKKNIHGEYRP